MPYIKSNDGRRKALRNGEPALSAGELNYQSFYYIKHNKAVKENVIYGSIKAYVDNFLGEKPNYQRYNDMTGAMVRCYKEIKRRLKFNPDFLWKIMSSYDKEIGIYEDTKIISNGDVEWKH